MTEILLIISHIFCGITAYGMAFAYFQTEYPKVCERDYKKDIALCLFFGICGIGGLLGVYFASEGAKHGIRFK